MSLGDELTKHLNAGSWQQRYLSSAGPERNVDSLASSVSLLRPEDPNQSFGRSPSPLSILSSNSTIMPPATLGGTDPAVFQATLEYFYTGSNTAEAFTVLLDGFGEEVREGESQAGGVDKLRQVRTRSRLFKYVEQLAYTKPTCRRTCCSLGVLTCTLTASSGSKAERRRMCSNLTAPSSLLGLPTSTRCC